MDRYVLFIDAAYLFAAGGELCYGTKRRNELEMNFRRAVLELQEICRKDSGLAPLRVYWYDAATDARPTAIHLQVAALQGVQLRLGRLTSRGQKGVDSRIVRDLIVLAHNRACTDAYLVSGDDDLREGVSEAQEGGLAVKLIGVEPLEGFQNQAPTLVRAADGTLTLSRDQISQFLQKRQANATEGATTAHPLAKDGDVFAIGVEFAQSLKMTAEQRAEILKVEIPAVPRELDPKLLVFAEGRLGRLPRLSRMRVTLRQGFRSGLKREGPVV